MIADLLDCICYGLSCHGGIRLATKRGILIVNVGPKFKSNRLSKSLVWKCLTLLIAEDFFSWMLKISSQQHQQKQQQQQQQQQKIRILVVLSEVARLAQEVAIATMRHATCINSIVFFSSYLKHNPRASFIPLLHSCHPVHCYHHMPLSNTLYFFTPTQPIHSNW